MTLPPYAMTRHPTRDAKSRDAPARCPRYGVDNSIESKPTAEYAMPSWRCRNFGLTQWNPEVHGTACLEWPPWSHLYPLKRGYEL